MVNEDKYSRSSKKALIEKLKQDNSEDSSSADEKDAQNRRNDKAEMGSDDKPSKDEPAAGDAVSVRKAAIARGKIISGSPNRRYRSMEGNRGKSSYDSIDSSKDSEEVSKVPEKSKVSERSKDASDKKSTAPRSQRPLFHRIWLIPGVLIIVVMAFLAFIWDFSSPEANYVGPLRDFGRPTYEFQPISNSYDELSRCSKVSGGTAPEINAGSYFAFYPENFQVAAEKNPDDKVAFASIAKLLGALVVLDNYDLSEEISLLDEVDTAGNGLDLVVGEKIEVEELLSAALVGSRNDAMYALAQNYPGGQEAFIEAMNAKAAVLGMENTIVLDVVGLDAEGQHSTPRDIGVLAVAAMNREEIKNIVSQPAITVTTLQGREIAVESTNPLIGEVDGVIGLKTGYTGEAGLCLVTYVDDQVDFVVVVLNAEDRAIASQKLVEWVRANYSCN
jgi:hypothetical protein